MSTWVDGFSEDLLGAALHSRQLDQLIHVCMQCTVCDPRQAGDRAWRRFCNPSRSGPPAKCIAKRCWQAEMRGVRLIRNKARSISGVAVILRPTRALHLGNSSIKSKSSITAAFLVRMRTRPSPLRQDGFAGTCARARAPLLRAPRRRRSCTAGPCRGPYGCAWHHERHASAWLGSMMA